MKELGFVSLECLILLGIVQFVTWMSVALGFSPLFYLLSDGLVSLALMGAIVVAGIPAFTGEKGMRGLLMAARICEFAALAGIIASVITAICLYL